MLERLPASTPIDELLTALDRDGAVIVEDMVERQLLSRLNADLDTATEQVQPGLRNPTHEFFIDFYGEKTKRIDGLPGRSDSFWELMLHPVMTGVADALLLPNCDHYLLNTGQLIQIGPGESAQLLHRDEDAWPYLRDPKPQLEVEAMFALSDFTESNGATQVVPGSHRWPAARKPEPGEITRAVMPAGAALVYLGSTLHGGGANETEAAWRRGVFMGFVLGWLRTEENCYLSVPIETVRRMPERAAQLLGYTAHGGIGVVDVGSPSAVLETPESSPNSR